MFLAKEHIDSFLAALPYGEKKPLDGLSSSGLFAKPSSPYGEKKPLDGLSSSGLCSLSVPPLLLPLPQHGIHSESH
jgi:hypothetical protein